MVMSSIFVVCTCCFIAQVLHCFSSKTHKPSMKDLEADGSITTYFRHPARDARLTGLISAFAPIMLQLICASAQLKEASADS